MIFKIFLNFNLFDVYKFSTFKDDSEIPHHEIAFGEFINSHIQIKCGGSSLPIWSSLMYLDSDQKFNSKKGFIKIIKNYIWKKDFINLTRFTKYVMVTDPLALMY